MSETDIDRAKNHYISWAHETIRFAIDAYGESAQTPTGALGVAYELWDQAVQQFGERAKVEAVTRYFAKLVLDWCCQVADAH